jgi:hypothetical protein
MTTHPQYVPQAHQTRQQPYTTSNSSELYWTLDFADAFSNAVATPVPPSCLQKTGYCHCTACKSTPTGWLCVTIFPFSTVHPSIKCNHCSSHSQSSVAKVPHHERSLFEETQKVSSRSFLCPIPPTTFIIFTNPAQTYISSSCLYHIAL